MEKEALEDYGYGPEENKSWLDMIIEYLKEKKRASQPKLEATT